MDILQSIDPTVVAIVLGLIVLSFIIMMCIYIPRIEKLRELENDKKRYKAERDYAVEQWSIAMISGNRQKDKILNDLKNTEGRKCQYSKIARTMAEAYDRVKKDLCIDIPKPELPVVFADKKPGQAGWYYYNDEWGYREEKDIVFWMPLPKPPKKEKEDE